VNLKVISAEMPWHPKNKFKMNWLQGSFILPFESPELFVVNLRFIPFYQHNGHSPAYNKDAWLRMMAKILNPQDKMSRNHPNGESSNNNN